jgi:hypothetical protein
MAMKRPIMALVALLLLAADAPFAGGDASGDSFQNDFIWIVAAAVAVVVVLAALFWWLRRGDRATKSRLAEARQGQFQMPPAEDSLGGPPPEQAPPP